MTYKDVTGRGLLREILQRSADPMLMHELEEKVKPIFIDKVQTYLNIHGLEPVEGALGFLESLLSRNDISVSFATGGWLESAKMKLAAAGFNLGNLCKNLGERIEAQKFRNKKFEFSVVQVADHDFCRGSLDGVVMASSNDHYRRTEIMKAALRKNCQAHIVRPIYFGDAEWGKKAC